MLPTMGLAQCLAYSRHGHSVGLQALKYPWVALELAECKVYPELPGTPHVSWAGHGTMADGSFGE